MNTTATRTTTAPRTAPSANTTNALAAAARLGLALQRLDAQPLYDGLCVAIAHTLADGPERLDTVALALVRVAEHAHAEGERAPAEVRAAYALAAEMLGASTTAQA